MTRRRWIADESQGNRAALNGSHAAHLARVLRASVGQEFEIATGEQVRLGRITAISDERVEFELGELVQTRPASPITLALAVFKFDRFEWAVEKCTELGVSRIVPVLARRTDTHLAAAASKRVDRWRRIAHEASQQSRRSAPPEIADPVKFKQYLAGPQPELRIVLAETEQQVHLREYGGAAGDVVLAVGPEGGWTEDELQHFASTGWKRASLGPTILRAETAAIVAVALIAALADQTPGNEERSA